MKIGIPALAGLSVLHGLVPPHPGPLTAIGLLTADLGRTLLFGILIAIPTRDRRRPAAGALRRPVGAPGAGAWRAGDRRLAGARLRSGAAVAGPAPDRSGQPHRRGRAATTTTWTRAARVGTRAGFGTALIAITLPVLLMLVDAIGELTHRRGRRRARSLDFIGTPPSPCCWR